MLDADGPVPREMVRDLLAIRRDPLGYLERIVARFGDLVAAGVLQKSAGGGRSTAYELAP